MPKKPRGFWRREHHIPHTLDDDGETLCVRDRKEEAIQRGDGGTHPLFELAVLKGQEGLRIGAHVQSRLNSNVRNE